MTTLQFSRLIFLNKQEVTALVNYNNVELSITEQLQYVCLRLWMPAFGDY